MQQPSFSTSIFPENGYFKVGELKTFHSEWQMIIKHIENEIAKTKADKTVGKKQKKALINEKT